MDELELLKKDWKSREHELPKLSYEDIYSMILKKSSSIVRWIFIISILEFVLWASLDIVFKMNNVHTHFDHIEKGTVLDNFSLIISIISYSILIYFIVRFYLNYKKIASTDSAKVLMRNIIKTRKTVKQYIFVNISLFAMVMITTMAYVLLFTEGLNENPLESQPPIWLIITITLLVTLIFVGLIALFYRVIYGILTSRLKKNYAELEKLDV
ncbi:hypothetical protein [Aquimarina pacifica]|uniref:hypothetical protein n=1 Tax=Aquimarina pacifica TaxID=1296415 RepID=UPI000471742D|nr:hypothetical protein [Aquimarina pacifica]